MKENLPIPLKDPDVEKQIASSNHSDLTPQENLETTQNVVLEQEPNKQHETASLAFILAILRIFTGIFFIIASSELYLIVKRVISNESNEQEPLSTAGAFFSFGLGIFFFTTFLNIIKDSKEDKLNRTRALSHCLALLGIMFWLMGTAIFFLYHQPHYLLGSPFWYTGLGLLIISNLIKAFGMDKLSLDFVALSFEFTGNILFLVSVIVAVDLNIQLEGAICGLIGAIFYLVQSVCFVVAFILQQREEKARRSRQEEIARTQQTEERVSALKRESTARAEQRQVDIDRINAHATYNLWISSKTGKVSTLTDDEPRAA